MDLYTELYQLNHTPDQVRARVARRELRRAQVYDRIRDAIGMTPVDRTAIKWNLRDTSDEADGGRAIGNMHPGAAAVIAVRAALAEFEFPTRYACHYIGMHRHSGRGQYGLEDGRVVVGVELQSVSGPKHWLEIPVTVKAGRMLPPGVLYHQGVARVITQNTFDAILKMGEFTQRLPDRKTMFAPPPEHGHPTAEVPLLRPGMFGQAPVNRALVASAFRGYAVEDVAWNGHDVRSQLDPRQDIQNQWQREYEDKRRRYEQVWGPIGAWSRDQDVHFQRGLPPEQFRRPAQIQGGYVHPEAPEFWNDPTALRQKLMALEEQYNSGQLSPEDEQFAALNIRDYKRRLVQLSRMPVAPRQAFYGPDVSGFVPNGTPGWDVPGADGSVIDVGERPCPEVVPGSVHHLRADTLARDRGGVAYRIPAGTECHILRDVDGAGRAFIAWLPAFGYNATIPAAAL